MLGREQEHTSSMLLKFCWWPLNPGSCTLASHMSRSASWRLRTSYLKRCSRTSICDALGYGVVLGNPSIMHHASSSKVIHSLPRRKAALCTLSSLQSLLSLHGSVPHLFLYRNPHPTQTLVSRDYIKQSSAASYQSRSYSDRTRSSL